MNDATTLTPRNRVMVTPDEIAANAFLVRYPEPTRTGYRLCLRQWFTWCAERNLHPLNAERSHIELWTRELLERRGLKASTVNGKLNAVVGFYRLAKIDGRITDNPADYIKRPYVEKISTREALTRRELAACLEHARQTSDLDHALWSLLGFNGLRISEACALDVDHLAKHDGQPTVFVSRRKKNLSGYARLSHRTHEAITRLVGTRSSGPIFRKPRVPDRLDPRSANLIVKRVVRDVGITKRISCHSLRHTAITLALDAGATTRDIRNTMGYTDDRPVAYYDRGRHNLNRDSSILAAAWVEAS